MNSKILRANLLLLCAAIVWGATFVAQRMAMNHMGPYSYSGMRFALGALCLAPLAFFGRRRKGFELVPGWTPKLYLWGSVVAGVLMAVGINLQQVGLVYTTAGKAGFITGLYVVIVPFLTLVKGPRTGLGTFLGAPLAAWGLFLMSVTEDFTVAPGDGWVMACAVAWAFHVFFMGWLSPRVDSFVLAFIQASVCSVLSFVMALFFEEIALSGIWASAGPLLFGGIGSVAIGFTFQVMGQKDAPPAHAAVIMELEAVFALVAGWLYLNESLGPRAMLGAALIFAGMLLSQLWPIYRQRAANRKQRDARAGL